MALTMTDEQERARRKRLASPRVLMNGECFCSSCAAIAFKCELDATRARVAEVERERDHWQRVAEEESWPYEWQVASALKDERDKLRAALAAREAECAELRAALDGVAKGDDELRIGGVTAWFQPKDNTPWSGVPRAAVDAARAILSRPPGTNAALRAWGVKVWDAACESTQKVERAYNAGQMWLVTKEETRERDIARLLPPATQAQGESVGGEG